MSIIMGLFIGATLGYCIVINSRITQIVEQQRKIIGSLLDMLNAKARATGDMTDYTRIME